MKQILGASIDGSEFILKNLWNKHIRYFFSWSATSSVAPFLKRDLLAVVVFYNSMFMRLVPRHIFGSRGNKMISPVGGSCRHRQPHAPTARNCNFHRRQIRICSPHFRRSSPYRAVRCTAIRRDRLTVCTTWKWDLELNVEELRHDIRPLRPAYAHHTSQTMRQDLEQWEASGVMVFMLQWCW